MAFTTEQAYGYVPVEGLAWAAAVIFLVLAGAVLYSNLKFPPNRFMHVLVGAALAEVAGFILRVVTIHNITLMTFIGATLILLLVPNFIALVNYMACGRLMAVSNQNVGCLRPTWLAKIFFIADFLSFSVQGMGGGMLASDDHSSQTMGKNIIILGLLLQSVALFLFLWVTITIHKQPRYQLRGQPDAERMFIGLYVTTALLFIRSLFRLVEYAAGEESIFRTKEWPFYLFEVVAMIGVFVVYALPAWHFGRCLNALLQQATRLPVTDPSEANAATAKLLMSAPDGATYVPSQQMVPIKG